MKPKVFEKISESQSVFATQTGASPRVYAGWVFSDEACRDGSSILQLGNVSIDPSFLPDDHIFE